mmetsp:Transcript_88585/g.129534  ORF Transcript_88585/g.129534 Transcript_88585/m.129534 type:complete len:110 (+) Transcript_88585:302-631(+)
MSCRLSAKEGSVAHQQDLITHCTTRHVWACVGIFLQKSPVAWGSFVKEICVSERTCATEPCLLQCGAVCYEILLVKKRLNLNLVSSNLLKKIEPNLMCNLNLFVKSIQT